MAFDFQSFQTVCNIATDIEESKRVGKGQVIRFRVAVPGERRKDESGQWTSQPVWLDCEAWQWETGQKLVEFIQRFGRKGMKVFLCGKLKMEEWEDKNGGGKRRAIKLTVQEFIPCDGKRDDGGESGESGGGYSGNRGRSGGYSKPKPQDDGGGYGYGGGEGGDDPIPF